MRLQEASPGEDCQSVLFRLILVLAVAMGRKNERPVNPDVFQRQVAYTAGIYIMHVLLMVYCLPSMVISSSAPGP